MSKSSLSEIQHQIKQNAEDYRNFVEELNDWQVETSKKSTSKSTALNSDKRAEPPIRSAGNLSNGTSVPISGEKPASVNKELAQVAKDTGNHYFKSGKFQKSIKYYTKAIDLDPETSILYVNRAFANLKLGQWSKAEEDCTQALEKDAKNVKAYWRRSQARKELNRLKEARADLESALVLEPQNTTLREALQSLPSTKAKPERRRLKIREIESNPFLISPVSEVRYPSAKENQSDQGKSKEEKPKKSVTKSDASTWEIPTVPATLQRWQPPTAAYEFDRDMKSLIDMGVRREYLKSIPPNKLPSLFKSSIDTTQLGICISILHSLMEQLEKPNVIYNYLYCLTQCPRFSIVYPMLEPSERESVISLFDFLHHSFQGNSEAETKITSLRVKYGI